MATRDEIQKELRALLAEGGSLIEKATGKGAKHPIAFGAAYQQWYTRALPIVRVLAPDRLDEFKRYYEADPKRKAVNAVTYVIQDYVTGLEPKADYRGQVPYNHHTAALTKLASQNYVLASLQSRIESVLANVEGRLLADLEDRELASAAKLVPVSLRAAGALAGVVLERHLAQIVVNRSLKILKRNPTIGDLNESLRSEGVYDLPTYRKVQHMSDIRNICCHERGREPTKEELAELLSGVASIINLVF